MNNLTDDELWDIIGSLKSSPNRYMILKTLGRNFSIPTEISKKSGINIEQVSKCLHDLKKQDLVTCLNDKASKGRIYKTTSVGLEVLDIIEKQINDLKEK